MIRLFPDRRSQQSKHRMHACATLTAPHANTRFRLQRVQSWIPWPSASLIVANETSSQRQTMVSSVSGRWSSDSLTVNSTTADLNFWRRRHCHFSLESCFRRPRSATPLEAAIDVAAIAPSSNEFSTPETVTQSPTAHTQGTVVSKSAFLLGDQTDVDGSHSISQPAREVSSILGSKPSLTTTRSTSRRSSEGGRFP